MNKIKILPDNLSNQIAAGEVVERPASAIKELLENSLDAGAKRLQIEVELGGRRLMRVVDDGEGMTRDDAVLAFERHATSKIKSLDDLAKIETLGFRGEALASIASVSKVELVTKIADETVGTRVCIEGGRLIDVKDAARPTGTTITIRDLFFNTPARRKFMRSEATENYHLTSIVTHYALAHPEIAFLLTNNGREVFSVAPARDLRERAYQIFGANLIESLLPVDGGRDFIAKIRGYVSAPRERRTTRDAQYFFINGRYVRDKVIASGLLEGYRAVLPHGVYPVAFLFLEIPLEEVDVNVHPAKTEVRFRRTEAVKEVIAEAVQKALRTAGISVDKANYHSGQISETEAAVVYQAAKQEEPLQQKIDFIQPLEYERNLVRNLLHLSEAETLQAPAENFSEESFSETGPLEKESAENHFPDLSSNAVEIEREEKLRSSAIPFDAPLSAIQSQMSAYPILPPLNSAEKLVKRTEIEKISTSKIRLVGQLHESYLIATDDEGLLLIDQHVAHERILFDKFRKREVERKIESQNLLLPETFDLTPAQAVAFNLVATELENLGFVMMRLSGRTIAIKAIPSDVPPNEARNLLAELLDTVDKEKNGGAKATLQDEIAASLACKAAVKVNMKLTPEKMQWLVDRLLTTSSPTTCPHGRPVILRLTMRDIERGFHRT